jgi:hypothetical protein
LTYSAAFARFILLLAVVMILFPHFLGQPVLAASVPQPRTQQQSTSLMEQSDFHRRQDKQKETRTVERQMASVDAAEKGSPHLDYVVLVLLVASVTAVFLLSRSRIQGRRVRTRL